MIIVYYKDRDGKITFHHDGRDHSADELRTMAEEYNHDPKGSGRMAYVEEVADDSLTAYLFQKAAERKKRDKEELAYAISSIEDALQAIQSLED